MNDMIKDRSNRVFWMKTCLIAMGLLLLPFSGRCAETELLKNGNFSGSGKPWSLFRHRGITGTVKHQFADNELTVVLNQKVAPQQVQLLQKINGLSGGENLTLSFEAKSTNPEKMSAAFTQSRKPFKTYGFSKKNIAVGAEWQSYRFTFKVRPVSADNPPALRMQLGGFGEGTVHLRNISLRSLPSK